MAYYIGHNQPPRGTIIRSIAIVDRWIGMAEYQETPYLNILCYLNITFLKVYVIDYHPLGVKDLVFVLFFFHHYKPFPWYVLLKGNGYWWLLHQLVFPISSSVAFLCSALLFHLASTFISLSYFPFGHLDSNGPLSILFGDFIRILQIFIGIKHFLSIRNLRFVCL